MNDQTLFYEKFSKDSAVNELLEDLNTALSEKPDMIMLGGGNPSHILEAENVYQSVLSSIIKDKKELSKMLGDYDGAKGNTESAHVLASYLRSTCGWNISHENIAFTNGSQTAFFILFNLLAGKTKRGFKKILFPLTPEYIGYSDVGLSTNMFTSIKPAIALLSNNEFKYKVDFNRLKINSDISALCLSRPTNPTGNVLTDDEMTKLKDFTSKHHIPLIVDNAYGMPFPNILFTKVKLQWNSSIIYTLSMSKLGLPGVRTGIIIASKEIIRSVAKVTAVMSLTPGRIGPTILKHLIMTKKIDVLTKQILPKYYQNQIISARKLAHSLFKDLPYRIHIQEGSFFLWIWFPKLPITSYELYERLKRKGVIVVPGEYFFPGMEKIRWKHKTECIRISCTPSEGVISKGFSILTQELKKLY
jgi:valine--pyruvate aminotransferase